MEETAWSNRRSMWVSQRLSLRSRFLVVALACLLPLIGVVLFVLDRSVENSRDQLRDTQEVAAQVVATALEAILEETQGVVDRLATLEEIRTEGEQTDDVLAQFHRARPSLSGLILLKPDGTIAATSGLDEASQIPTGLVDAVWPALMTNQVVVSDRLFVPDGDVIAVAAPVLPGDATEGKPVGAVAALLPVERLQGAAVRFVAHDTEASIMVVANAELIAEQGSVDPVGTILDPNLAEALELAMGGTVGSRSYRDAADAERFAAFAPVEFPGSQWVALVTYPAPTVFGSDRSLLEQGLLALAVAVAVTIALAFLLGEWIARPLRLLRDHAAALTRGEFDRPPPTGGSGELGELSLAFREMSSRLAEHVRDLEATREENAQRAEELRELNRRTIRLQEDERRRIAADIHDAVSPLITGALYQARAISLANGSSGPDDDEEALDAVGDLLARAMDELHRVIFDLRPPDLDDLGVVAAIERYVSQVERAGLTCRLEVVGPSPALTPEVRLAVYRIVQEALHNALRHARADVALVRLETNERLVRVTIEDNGAGFDPEASGRPTALGLLSMRERANAIGATFAVASRPGDGTRIVVERPFGGDAAHDHLTDLPVASDTDHAEAPPSAWLPVGGISPQPANVRSA